ncbi:MAG: hypothetical protein WC381_11415 [Kiritimatiellia bacterium]|jgi:hypothetical protein
MKKSFAINDIVISPDGCRGKVVQILITEKRTRYEVIFPMALNNGDSRIRGWFTAKKLTKDKGVQLP